MQLYRGATFVLRQAANDDERGFHREAPFHPEHQGHGLGAAIINRLVTAASGHKKIILYANPGTESFYAKLGFLPMNTAMAIWHDPAAALESGVLRQFSDGRT